MVKTQLKDCPFCANQLDRSDVDTLHQSGTTWTNEQFGRAYHDRHYVDPDGYCYEVNCCAIYGGCGANITGDSREEAIERWNTRNIRNTHNTHEVIRPIL